VSGSELTRRETDVLVALCRPLSGDGVVAQPASVKEIAAELVVTEAAVKQHLLHLYDKLEISEGGERRRVTLAREAVRRGLVNAPRRAVEDPVAEDVLTEGRIAFERHDWERCERLLSAADADGQLAVEDLLTLGEALLWVNRHDESFAVQQRAYQAYVRAGDERRAGFVAVLLTIHYAVRLEMAVAGGWLAKAHRLLDASPDCHEYGYLAFVHLLEKEAAAEWSAVGELAGRMRELGRTHRDPGLEAMGLAFEGVIATRRGALLDGSRLLDEAMAGAVAGELGMIATGVIYCRMMSTCLALQDYRRAGEWTEVVDRCGHTRGLGGFPGDCRAHRTTVLMKRGEWARGEREALRAFDETQQFDLQHSGAVSYELGELKLRQGDLDGAEEAFVRAHQFGFPPRPGRSRVHLARGDIALATASIEEALAEAASDPLTRARLLPAKVEIGLASGDRTAIRAAAEELVETAETFGAPALRAAAALAKGAAAMVGGDPADAARYRTDARNLCLEAELPYEAASSRELLAEAQLSSGRMDSGHLELQAAHASFQRLGARLDVERVERRLRALSE
jgi:hypothetical protein